VATYHAALEQDPQSADVAGKIESLTQLVREKSHTMLQQYPTSSQRKSMDPSTTASEEQQLDVVSTSIPDPPADHLWSHHHQEAHKFVGSPIAASWRTYCAVRLQGSSRVCGEL